MSKDANDPFLHDAAAFVPAASPSSVGVSDAEARYAELFAEVTWDGLLTAEKRQQLRNAAMVFGLDPERARQIEDALSAAHAGLIFDEPSVMDVAEGEVPSLRAPLAPLGDSEDPRLVLLERRIHVLEEERQLLTAASTEQTSLNQRLERLVSQLQHALEITMEDLEAAGRRASVAEKKLASATQALSREPVERISAPPPLPVSVPVPPSAGPNEVAGSVQARSRRLIRESTALRAVAASARGEPLREATADGAPGAVVAPHRANPGEIHRLVCRAPRDAELLRALYRSLGRADDLDRRFCVAHALVFLGEASDEERQLHQTHAKDGLIRPKRAINEDEWRELLFHPDEDRLTGEIFGEVAPAMLLGHMTALRASLVTEVVDPAQRMDARQSTVQAVRCFAWAADLLSLEVPAVYACPELEICADMVLVPSPSTRLGRRALVGRSVRELAFLAGRHLTFYRKEHLLAKPTGSARRLEDMFLAALAIGNPGLPLAEEVRRRIQPVVLALEPLLGKEAKARLARSFGRFVEQGGRTKLSRWLAALELTASRVGLLLAGDLAAAESMLILENPEQAGPQLESLLGYFTSVEFSTLRKRIGIAVVA